MHEGGKTADVKIKKLHFCCERLCGIDAIDMMSFSGINLTGKVH